MILNNLKPAWCIKSDGRNKELLKKVKENNGVVLRGIIIARKEQCL